MWWETVAVESNILVLQSKVYRLQYFHVRSRSQFEENYEAATNKVCSNMTLKLSQSDMLILRLCLILKDCYINHLK